MLQRYILGQLLRAFLMALLTITVIFSLFIVMAEATRQGLAPQEVLSILPYLVPGSLPYTVPVALLFAVSVVYGRFAGDNEVTAIKSAGMSHWTVLRPALLLGSVLSVFLFATSSEVIPRANNTFRAILFGTAEDGLYRFLKKEHQINNPRIPFVIQVSDIRERVLIDPLFKHRAPSPPNPPDTFDLIVQAKTAVLQFDMEREQVIVQLEDAQTAGQASEFLLEINGTKVLQFPMPKAPAERDRRVQELTNGEIAEKQLELQEKIDNERRRQAFEASLWIAGGNVDRVDWRRVRAADIEFPWWSNKKNELETEKYVRVALAAGAFFFVLLGAPVGILFAKRDFLSAFITCFVPIIVLYYPLVVAGINLGKEGVAHHSVVFAGDGLLAFLAGFFALPPIRKH
jgi:lipopolysaccharide export system permease protein